MARRGPAGRGGASPDEVERRLATLARPLAAAVRARAIAAAPARAGRPRVDAGVLVAGEPAAAAALWDDARAIAPLIGAAYAADAMAVAPAAPSVEARAHHDAAVPLTHWICDGLAELEAIALLVGATRLGELDAAVADALDDWQTSGGDATPRVARLEPAIARVQGELAALCARGADARAAIGLVAPIVALIEVMRLPPAAPWRLALDGLGGGALGRATAALRAELGAYRAELTRLGLAIDRAAVARGDAPGRIELALGVAARAAQVAAIAAALTAWIDRAGAANAAQRRWRGAAATIEEVLGGTLAGVRRLVPLPP